MIKLMDLLEDSDLESFIDKMDEIELDPNVDLTFDNNSGTFPFDINGKKYEVNVDKKLTQNKKSIAEFKFYLVNSEKTPKRKDFATNQQYIIALQKSQVGITGTGDSFSVFSKVLSIMVKYCNVENIDYITFTADEENRQKLYVKILQKLIKKYNIPYKQLNTNPLTNDITGPEEFWLEKV